MNNVNFKVKPFLRWAGGKTWLLKDIHDYLPSKFNNYYEPFIGGGSVYIYLKSINKIQNEAFLSDQNEDLINAYNVLKMEPYSLIDELKEYRNEKDFYYYIREQKKSNNIQKAAQFIFLNRTSFNGIYRVNLKGIYNVPFGFKTYKSLFDFENLIKLSQMFEKAHFNSWDFESILENVKKDDLVFLDPPYTVAHENNGFIKYNQKIFSWSDQERLKDFVVHLNEIGAYFILTNANHESILTLYNGVGNNSEKTRPSLIGGKGARRANYKEILITNINRI